MASIVALRMIKALLPKPRIRKDQRGRPWRDPRDVLNGILWILRTGAVGRLTGSVSIEVDLPSAVPTMAARRDDDPNQGRTAQGPRPAREDRLG